MTRIPRVVLAIVAITAASICSSTQVAGTTISPTSFAGLTDAPEAASTIATTLPAASSIDPASAMNADARGARTVYVSIVSATASTADDVNTVSDADAAGLVSAMNAYWSAESGGTVSVALGGIERRALDANACAASDVFSRAPLVAFAGRFASSAWTGTGDHLLVLTTESCGQAGLGSTSGGGGVMLSGNGTSTALSVPVAVHEFGHNLGFGHAGSAVCRSASVDGAATDFGDSASLCPTDAYGDYLDIMGYSLPGAMPHLSTLQRIRSGYLSDYRSIDASSGAVTATVAPLDGPAVGRALRVIDPLSGARYYVEFRTASGTDATSTEFTTTEECTPAGAYSSCSRGAPTTGSVRVLREVSYGTAGEHVRSVVLAAGSVSDTARRTRLTTGDDLTSAQGGFYLHVGAIAAAGARVTVRFTPPPATTTALAVDGAATQSYGTSASHLVAHVKASDGSTPTGTVIFRSGKRTLGSTALVDGVADLRVPAKLHVGRYAVRAVFTPAEGDSASSTSSSRRVTVARASAKARVHVDGTGASRTARVRVSATGGVRATGRVVLRVGDVRLAHALPRSGRVTLHLPSTATGKVTVRYLGSHTVAKATARGR
jgi:hypothetical protein